MHTRARILWNYLRRIHSEMWKILGGLHLMKIAIKLQIAVEDDMSIWLRWADGGAIK